MAGIGNHGYILKCQLAVASARKVDDPLRLAHAVRHLGDAYYYARRTGPADACYVEALRFIAATKKRGPLTSPTPFEVSRYSRMKLTHPKSHNFCGGKRMIFTWHSTFRRASLRAPRGSRCWLSARAI